ncbi:MAG: hypothetical protein FJ102_09175 [Deltaproteobacteria bacterium]|nr:hypothetical protein [Deltaproteobacteria bacterium]
MRLVLALLLVGCGSTWNSEDLDGDGYTVAEGDCWDNPTRAAANGMTGEEIYPGKSNETYYDGVDENCDGLSDYDKDLDGHDALAHGGDDCWDDPDPDAVPGEFDALEGYYDPLAKEVFPGAEEVWYDAVDSDCDGGSDFDQDLDGFDTMWHEQRDGSVGTDCLDADDDPQDNPAAIVPNNVNPDATDAWYDGTDANCDGADDYDQDQDGFPSADYGGNDCDDLDPERYPNDEVETWYDGVDSNCDGQSDYDQDGDGHDASDYGGDDCNDDPAAPAAAINGFDDVEARAMHPAAADEPYDGVDADCAGDDDFDADGDGQSTADFPDEGGQVGQDCDDTDGTVYVGALDTWYDGVDSNCGGGSDYDQDGDGYDSSAYGFGSSDDCDDVRGDVYPGAEESCADPADQDCDGIENDTDATDCTEFFADDDADSYGDLADSLCRCDAEGVYTAEGTTAATDDCDDTRATVNPGVSNESCSTTYDDDCDGVTNEQNASSCTTYYTDVDDDGYGLTTSQCWCSESGNYRAANDDDCDDGDDDIHPGATEACDGVDEDCDGSVDEGTTHYYADDDDDGYGDDSTESCSTSSGAVTTGGDCDDTDERVYPAAPELCDEQQNDCDDATWTAASEEGTVSYVDASLAWTDKTSFWAAGTAAAPVSISLDAGTYYVCPATWYVGVVASSETVDLIAPYGATDTILSRGGISGTVVYATSSVVYLEGLTITGGVGTTAGSYQYGGGVLSLASSDTTVSQVTLYQCLVTGNDADYGGGVAAYNYGDIILEETDVYDNTADVSGAGILVQRGDVSCENGGVYDNTSVGEGGGAYFSHQAGNLDATNCDWTGNSPDDIAGSGSGFTTVPSGTVGSGGDADCQGFYGCF